MTSGGSRQTRRLALLTAICFLLVVVSVPVVADHNDEYPDKDDVPPEKHIINQSDSNWTSANQTRIFDATRNNTDPEPSGGYYQRLTNLQNRPLSEIDALQTRFDFFYRHATPSINYSNEHKYDLEDVYQYEFENFTKRLGNATKTIYLEESPPLKSWRFVKDAHLTVLGSPDEVVVKGENVYDDEPTVLPDESQFYQFGDYRVEPDNESELYLDETHVGTVSNRSINKTQLNRSALNHTRIENQDVEINATAVNWFEDSLSDQFRSGGDYNATETNITRVDWRGEVVRHEMHNNTLYLGSKNESGVFGGWNEYGAGIQYSPIGENVSNHIIALSVAEINITVAYRNVTYQKNESGWTPISQSFDTQIITRNLTKHSTYRYLSKHNIRTKQVVYNEPDGSTRTIVKAGVTEWTSDEQVYREPVTSYDILLSTLWSQMHFGGADRGRVDNVWGIYSIGDEYQGYRETASAVNKTTGLTLPRQFATPDFKTPDETRMNAITEPLDREYIYHEKPRLHENVILNIPDESRTYSKVLYHDPNGDSVSYMQTILGDRFPVNTSRVSVQQTELQAETFGDRKVRFRLLDGNGNPLANRDLDIDGAIQPGGTTNESGYVVVDAESQTVSAKFVGYDPLEVDREDGTQLNSNAEAEIRVGKAPLVERAQPMVAWILRIAAPLFTLVLLLGLIRWTFK